MSDKIVIGKHTLESITSGMYSDPFVVFREYIQNAVDSIDNAVDKGIIKNGEGQIIVKLAPLEKRIIIKDNGIGISASEAENTLISIGNSKKTSDTARGFRGIGRLSALSYCEKLTFITTTSGEKLATKVTLDAFKLSQLLSSEVNDNKTVVEVLKEIYSVEYNPEDESAHYFIVEMDGVQDNSNLNTYDDVIDYLKQNVPVPYDPSFVWGKEITNRLRQEGYCIDTYNVSVIFGTKLTPIYKPYCDEFLVDKSKNIKDHIHDIDIVSIDHEDGTRCAIGWLAKTSYLGSIYDKSIKGIRLRKGNILIGDQQTLNIVFKDARFNGWSIGEIFAVDKQLIPNARRDNFEKNTACFFLLEQLSRLSSSITKDIRAASLKRNSELSSAIAETDKVSRAAKEAIDSGIAHNQKGVISHKLKTAQRTVLNSCISDDSGDYYQTIAFDELDMLIGKLKGATSYKALNALDKLTITEKKILEKVFDTISSLKIENAEVVIDALLDAFDSEGK